MFSTEEIVSKLQHLVLKKSGKYFTLGLVYEPEGSIHPDSHSLKLSESVFVVVVFTINFVSFIFVFNIPLYVNENYNITII